MDMQLTTKTKGYSIFLVLVGLKNAIFSMGDVSKMPLFGIRGLENANFWYIRVKFICMGVSEFCIRGST